jgi:hypothetical protein
MLCHGQHFIQHIGIILQLVHVGSLTSQNKAHFGPRAATWTKGRGSPTVGDLGSTEFTELAQQVKCEGAATWHLSPMHLLSLTAITECSSRIYYR